MAVDLGAGNTTRCYTIPHANVLDGAGTGWCWGIWTRIDANPGTFHYLLASGSGSSVNGGSNIFLRGAEDPGTPGSWAITARGDSGVGTGNTITSSVPGADSKNRLIIHQYTGTTIQCYFCLPGATPSLEVSSVITLGAMTAPTDWHVGWRPDLDTTRIYEEHFGELFKGDRPLTTDEIAAIARGTPPIRVLNSSLAGWWNFFEPTATVKDLVGVNDATRVGTSYPAASEHFPLQTARTFVVFAASAAAIYTQTKFRVFNDDGVGLGPPP